MTDTGDSLANEILRGAAQIAAYRGEKRRRTYSLLERGLIPGRKVGEVWESTKTEQRQYYGLDGQR
jgi:hypothetical protein